MPRKKEPHPADGTQARLQGTPPPWRTSRAKTHLRSLLLDSSSWIQILEVEEIHRSEPLFLQYPLRSFKTNYKNLMKAVQLEKAAVEFDEEAVISDMTRFPRNAMTERGNPFWHGDNAQMLLAEDVKNGLSLNGKPSELRDSRAEYGEFPFAVFRNHLYQEERKAREKLFWQKKRNDKGRKQHEKEVEEMD
jgi:hypothetical protein